MTPPVFTRRIAPGPQHYPLRAARELHLHALGHNATDLKIALRDPGFNGYSIHLDPGNTKALINALQEYLAWLED